MSHNPIESWDLRLAKRIVSMYPNRFIGAIILAERGYGKSMYALKNMAYVFHVLFGLDEREAFNKAIEYMIFTPKQLEDRVDYNIENDVIDPVWCIDDATVHFSSYLHYMNVYEAALLGGTFDTLRTVTSCLLVTCPKKKRLFPPLREYDQYNVIIYQEPPGGGYQRKSIGVNWFTIPDGRQRFKKRFEDYFSCYVPDEYYNKYLKIRKGYVKDIRKRLKKLRAELEEKKKKGVYGRFYKEGESSEDKDFSDGMLKEFEDAPVEPEPGFED